MRTVNPTIMPQQQQSSGLLGSLFSFLPQIAGAFGTAAGGPAAGAAAGAGTSLLGKALGAGNSTQQAGSQIASLITPGQQQQATNGGAGAVGAQVGQQLAQQQNPTPVNESKQEGGGDSQSSHEQGHQAAPTDPLNKAEQGPPIGKEPLHPNAAQQSQIMEFIAANHPDLFTMSKSNPEIGEGLMNMWNQMSTYNPTGIS